MVSFLYIVLKAYICKKLFYMILIRLPDVSHYNQIYYTKTWLFSLLTCVKREYGFLCFMITDILSGLWKTEHILKRGGSKGKLMKEIFYFVDEQRQKWPIGE